MKIFKNNQLCDISQLIVQAKQQLANESVYILSTHNHLEHFAAYLAWREVGGNIFVKSPALPPEQDDHVMQQVLDMVVTNSILFHTSGTSSGRPKVVINTLRQLEQAATLSTAGLQWNTDSHFMNFLPAFTSGFWHIVMPAVVKFDCPITLGRKETVVADLANPAANRTILVAGLINMLAARNISVDLSHFDTVGVGASAVDQRHAEYVLGNGAKNFAHLYGATEIGSPILSRITDCIGDHNEYLELNDCTQLVDNELWVKGASVCENYQDFLHDGEWFRTGDLWESQGNLIKFAGRSSDVVKINGYQCNLQQIETVMEQRTPLGECLARPRQTLGTEWIELLYTSPLNDVNKHQIKSQVESVLTLHSIPKKYTRVNEIPKNSLGKKIRYA